MTVDYFYKLVQDIAGKNQFGDIKPEIINKFGSMAQNEFYDYLIGQLEQFRYDKPVPRVAVGMNAKVAQFLLPLKVTNVTINVSGGVAAFPTDFNYLSLMTNTAKRKVDILDDTKFPGRYGSSIDPVTDTDTPPFGKLVETGWEVYPTAMTQVVVSYYKRPANVIWNFDESSGRPVYNPTGSIDPIFDDVAMTKVIGRVCKLLGIPFKEDFILEYGKEVQAAGE